MIEAILKIVLFWAVVFGTVYFRFWIEDKMHEKEDI